MDALRIVGKGIADCWIRTKEGVLIHHGTFSNCFTNNCLERLLRTLLQVTGGGDEINGTNWPKKLLYCSGDMPSEPWDAAIPDIADIEGSADFDTLADITESSSSCYATDTAEWTNGGGDVTINYLATAYSVAVGKDNIYNMVEITERDVLAGQTFIVNYTWKFYYDTDDADV